MPVEAGDETLPSPGSLPATAGGRTGETNGDLFVFLPEKVLEPKILVKSFFSSMVGTISTS